MCEQMALMPEKILSKVGVFDLAVIIVNWNVRDILVENLKALFEGSTDVNFEVIVIDNASFDGSVEAIRSQFPNVRLIANEKNLGFATAVNQGLRVARSRHVLLLNPDMLMEACALEKIIGYLDAHPDVGVLSGKLIDENWTAMHHMRRFPSFASQLAVILKLPHFFPKILDDYHGKDLDLDKEQSVDTVRGSFFAISEQALLKVGNFDEGFFVWFEEVDYCRRVKEAEYNIRYVPNIVAHDLIGKSFAKQKVYWKQKQFTASMIHYFKKWHPRWQSLILQLFRPSVLSIAFIHDTAIARSGSTRQSQPLKRDEAAASGEVGFAMGNKNATTLAIQMVLYKSVDDLPALLESLKAQTCRDFELFVYHNFDSFFEMEACRKLIEASGLRHHYFAGEENIGFAGGHEALYRKHEAPFLMLLNDDAKLMSNYVSNVMRRMESDERIGSVSGLIYRWPTSAEASADRDEITIDTAGLEYICLGQVRDRFAGQTLPASSYMLMTSPVFGVSGAVGLYRRSAIEKSGGLFDSSWFMYKEDVDLALRLKRAGYSAWFEPSAIGYHKRELKQSRGLLGRWLDERKRPKKLRVYAYANQLKVYRRHFNWSLGIGDITRSLAVEGARSFGTLLSSPSVFIEAWKLAWKS